MPPPPRWNCSKPSGSDASTSTIWRWPTGSELASGSSRAIQRSFRSTPLTTRPGRLAGAGVKAAVRANRVRPSCHLYNDEEGVDFTLEVLTDSIHAGGRPSSGKART